MKSHCAAVLCLFGIFSAVNGRCPKQYQEIGDSCFYFDVYEATSWQRARDKCQEIGGDLAIFTDCKLFTEVVRFIHWNDEYEVPNGFSYWIGGSDNGAEGEWYWVDYTPISVGVPLWGTYNGTPQPTIDDTQNCAAMYKDDRYYIHDATCENLEFSLCQTEKTDE